MKTAKCVIWPRKNKNNMFLLKIRFFSEHLNKYQYSNLNIEISNQKLFNKKTGFVRESHPDHQNLNKIITDNLNSYNKKNDGNFYEFYQDYINFLLQTDHTGYSIKHNTVLKKLKKFKKNLNFSDLNSEFPQQFYVFCKNSGMAENGIFDYFKKLKNVCIKARQKNLIQGNIFEFFKIKKQNTVSKSWTEAEFNYLINYNFFDNEKFQKMQKMIAFAFFAKGIRINDLINLKWSNIQGEYLIYTMVKTHQTCSIQLNEKILNILIDLIDFNKDNKTFTIDIDRIKTYTPEQKISLVNRHAQQTTAYLFYPDKNIDYYETRNKIARFNFNLKKMCKTCQIRPLSSHSIRHTYASLFLKKTNNIKAVQQNLFHKSLAITQNYINNLSDSDIKHIDDKFLKDF